MNYSNINMTNCPFLNISLELKKYHIKYKKKNIYSGLATVYKIILEINITPYKFADIVFHQFFFRTKQRGCSNFVRQQQLRKMVDSEIGVQTSTFASRHLLLKTAAKQKQKIFRKTHTPIIRQLRGTSGILKLFSRILHCLYTRQIGKRCLIIIPRFKCYSK